jgi:hypothetical protein
MAEVFVRDKDAVLPVFDRIAEEAPVGTKVNLNWEDMNICSCRSIEDAWICGASLESHFPAKASASMGG